MRHGAGCVEGAGVRRKAVREAGATACAHLARCASAHLVGGRVNDEGGDFQFTYPLFSEKSLVCHDAV